MDLLTLRKHRDRIHSFRQGTVLAAVLALAGFSTACSGGAARGAQPQGPPGIPVKIQTAQLVSVNDTTEYVATLKSRDTAVIMPQVEGVITQIFVHSGSRVAAGTPLMQIDQAKQQATLKTQEDNVAAKQAELVWDQQEFDRNSVRHRFRHSARHFRSRRNDITDGLGTGRSGETTDDHTADVIVITEACFRAPYSSGVTASV